MMSIVIIGANFAGMTAAKAVFDSIFESKDSKNYTVTVISPSSKVYYNPASPRMIVEPHLLEKAFFDVEETLKDASKGAKFTYINGKVNHADFKCKKLEVELMTKVGAGAQTIHYDYLIVASGARSSSAAWKLDGDYKNSENAIKDLHNELEKSNKIAILGGGVTGTEVAGEIADKYPNKKIILYTGDSGPLSSLGPSKSKQASEQLKALGVEIVNGIRSTDIIKKENGTEISFDDGTVITVDLHISTIGVFPNTDFIDKNYLNKYGYLEVGNDLVVKGEKNVIALGDVCSISANTIVDLKYAQEKQFKKTISSVIFGNGDVGSYVRGSTTIMVPISRKGGVGLVFGWSVPSFLVKVAKSRDYMLGQAKGMF